MTKQFIRVVNWEKHQHYKDRNPPWIKLHNTILEDPAVAALPDAAKAHLFGLWLLASRSENKIPADPAFVGKRINATTKVDLRLLMLLGFIELHPDCLQDASNPLATCSTETETEQRRAEKRQRQTAAKVSAGAQSPEANEAIEAYNATFGARIGHTPGNLRAAVRALDAGYSLDHIRGVFAAVRERKTPTAIWCAENNREFEYLIRPPYKHIRTQEVTQGPLDKIPNELATGRRAG
jgi:hypothetical protein